MSNKEFKLNTSDRKKLYGRAWVPHNPIATVCMIHGWGEHIGRYDHVARHLNQSGIAVYGIDLRGHGRSPGKRGHARCYRLWNDLESLMKHARLQHLDVPLFLYGHSWGGNIVGNFLLRRNSSEIRGSVLSSPWIKLSFEPSKLQLLLGRWMSRIYPAFTQTNDLDVEFLSRDLSVGKLYLEDPLVHAKISAGLFTEAVTNGQYLLNHAHQLVKPLLIMHGTADQITSHLASKALAQSAQDPTLKLWPDMRHETHNELGKREVLEFVTQWLVKMTF